MELLNKAEIFVNVAKYAGFTPAANVMGITSSAVSKQILGLEEALGVKLFNRTTRKVSLTEEGQLYYERMAQILEQAAEAQALVTERAASPKGTLKVSVPQDFGRLHLKDALTSFIRAYPDITLCTQFSNRMVDIQGDGFDVAIRIGALADSSLVAHRLGGVSLTLTASPAYLKEHGTPKKPVDLKRHRMLSYSYNEQPLEWQYRDPKGGKQQISLKAHFFSDSGDMLMDAAVHGLGIAILPTFYTRKHVEVGTLKTLLPEYVTQPERAIYAVMPPTKFMPSKLRVFIDHMAAYMKRHPA